MIPLFLDTTGWFAAMSSQEPRHAKVREAYCAQLEGGGLLVTTNLIVAEMQLLLTCYRGGDEGLRFLDSLYGDASHVVRFIDREFERIAIDDWLRRFRGSALSLTDAVSFAVMREQCITSALTIDARYAVAGFQMVP